MRDDLKTLLDLQELDIKARDLRKEKEVKEAADGLCRLYGAP